MKKKGKLISGEKMLREVTPVTREKIASKLVVQGEKNGGGAAN